MKGDHIYQKKSRCQVSKKSFVVLTKSVFNKGKPMKEKVKKKQLGLRGHHSALKLCAIMGLFGCQASIPEGAPKDSIPAKELAISPFLGQAYNASSKNILNLKCVSYKETTTNEGSYLESSLKFATDMTSEEIINSLVGNLSVEVKFPLVKAKAGANYAAEAASTESSRNFSIDYTIRGPSRKVDLESIGLSAIGKKYANEKSGDLQELCGDSFISEVTQGAKLFITMKFDFLNSHNKQEVGGFLDFDMSNPAWKVKLEGSLKSIRSEDKKNISMSVMGIQIGGDVTGLSKILPANVASCSLEVPEPCIKAMEMAMDYAQNDFVTGVKQSGWSSIAYLTSKYNESGLDDLVPPQGYPIVDEAVKIMQEEMNSRYAATLVHQKRASTIISQFASYIPSTLLAEIKDIKTKTIKNANNLVRGGVYCYENPNQKCLDQAEKILAALEPIDVKKLSLEADEMIDFARCEKARKFALLNGLISRSDYDYYRLAEWAPDFVDAQNPSKGVAGWMRCLSIVTSYGSYFDGLYE